MADMHRGHLTAHEIYRAIEEQTGTYLDRIMKKMLSEAGTHALTTEDIHLLRGKALAIKQITNDLRNTLGYDYKSLG